jgi:hypothetical protein
VAEHSAASSCWGPGSGQRAKICQPRQRQAQVLWLVNDIATFGQTVRDTGKPVRSPLQARPSGHGPEFKNRSKRDNSYGQPDKELEPSRPLTQPPLSIATLQPKHTDAQKDKAPGLITGLGRAIKFIAL